MSDAATTTRSPKNNSPTFIEPLDLPHPAIPPALDGLTILHLSDFHIRFPLDSGRHKWLGTLLADLRSVEPDLIVLTGDYIDAPRHEQLGLDLLRELSRAWRTKNNTPALAIFGNHDTPRFRRMALERATEHNIRWLGVPRRSAADAPQMIETPRGPLTILGLDHPEDFLPCLQNIGKDADAALPLLTLAHEPTALIPAAQLNLPILLCGHTHGGQVRLSPRFAPHTSSDTPPHLAAGIIRLNKTLCCISRGLGDGVLEGLRINCPRQIPLYTLRRGPLPGAAECDSPTQVLAW